MSAPVFSRKGWCPGALRPMPSGDGLLLRLRPRNGAFTWQEAAAIAACAAHYGNGQIELSSRGNLQLRGLTAESLPKLRGELARFGLLDETAEAEAIRNIQISPLAGLGSEIDIRPLTEDLAQALANAKDLHALPAKFGFLIDDGSLPSLADCAADLRFDYQASARRFSIGLGGTAASAIRLGSSAGADLVPLALSLARTFLALRALLPEAPRRMHQLMTSIGANAFAQAAGRALTATLPPQELPRAPEKLPIGLKYFNGFAVLGTSVPFGLMTHVMLAGLAEAARQSGGASLRLTPWRLLLLADIAEEQAERLTDILSCLGFILDPQDPRLAIAACPGAPACAEAARPVRNDAAALVSLIPHRGASGVMLHVSGCAKGCAHPAPAPFTLVARDGLYDLILNGTSRSLPFYSALTLEAVRQTLAGAFSAMTGTRP